MRPFRLLAPAAALLAVAAIPSAPAAQERRDPREYFTQEQVDYFGGLVNLGPNYERGFRVYRQLVEHSRQQYPVFLAQTFQWGQAHAGGTILMDVSTLQKRDEILAFVFAHEWGHQVLGHQPNLYNPYGNAWRVRTGPTSVEDAADRYAGGFLARYGYDLAPVLSYLSTLPVSPHGDAHSDGPQRARTVRLAYEAAAGRVGGGTPGPACRQVVVMESYSEMVTRMVERTVPCRHCWMTNWGPRCEHPAHVEAVPVQVPVTGQRPVTRTVCP